MESPRPSNGLGMREAAASYRIVQESQGIRHANRPRICGGGENKSVNCFDGRPKILLTPFREYCTLLPIAHRSVNPGHN